jgi:hypothetical protein
MWAQRTNRGQRFLAQTEDVPLLRDLLEGYVHPDELGDPEDEEPPWAGKPD